MMYATYPQEKNSVRVCVHVCVHVHVEIKYEKTNLEKCLKLVICKVKNYLKIIFQVLYIDQLAQRPTHS